MRKAYLYPERDLQGTAAQLRLAMQLCPQIETWLAPPQACDTENIQEAFAECMESAHHISAADMHKRRWAQTSRGCPPSSCDCGDWLLGDIAKFCVVRRLHLCREDGKAAAALHPRLLTLAVQDALLNLELHLAST
jgi:hypothetical protein